MVVFIPFNNIPVPFHISTIRSVQWQTNDTGKVRFATIRFTFHVPGSGDSEILPDIKGEKDHWVYIKECAVKSEKPHHCQELVKKIQDIQKRLKSKESLGPIAPIAPLEVNRNPQKTLIKHVLVRYLGAPSRRSIGNLEAHQNGVRYTGAGGRDIITINYSNVKHCIFQPCKNDLHTILQFHLKSPIMINQKRQTDIQFYTEVCSVVDDLQSRRRRMRDPDELEEEAKEIKIQNRTNMEYRRFVEGMEQFAKNYDMVCEVPIRKLAFRGVPKNENVLLMPTARALVHLSQWPTFVVTLEDIEVVCLERVSHGLRNFDLTIIFKDHSRQALTINSCDVSAIDQIKRWLTECDLVWYESTLSLNWKHILKTIRADPRGFYNDVGGFGAFMADGDDPEGLANDGNDSSSDDDDALFKDEGSSSSDGESDLDSSDAGSKSSDEESGSGAGSASGSDKEDVEEDDWDEMEKNAAREDRGRADSDDNDSPKAKKRKPNPNTFANLAKKRRL